MSTLLYFDKKKKIAYILCKYCDGEGYSQKYIGDISYKCYKCEGKKYIEIKIKEKK